MNDPYCWSGTDCLRNKLNIRDSATLATVEARIVSIRDVQAARQTIVGEYDLEHLQSFHKHLFQDIYHWAGQTRTVNILKPGAAFAHFAFVDTEVSSVLGGLRDEYYLLGLNQQPFVERLAYYYGEINARHPFREGNGRTQRAFFRQLAAAAGWRLDWSGLDPDENIAASRSNLWTASTEALIAVLLPLLSKLT